MLGGIEWGGAVWGIGRVGIDFVLLAHGHVYIYVRPYAVYIMNAIFSVHCLYQSIIV